jgi:hypothetical protein
VTSNQKFDIFIMICIFLNMMTMCLEYYNQPADYSIILDYVNLLFIVIFAIESIMKLLALNWRFFKFAWNVFDLFIVLISIFGVAFEQVLQHILFFSPTILRVMRVIRVGRILRLVKGARGIRTLLFALAVSLPALVNIGLLLFLVIFIYAIFGMNFFMYVGYSGIITEQFNFETVFRSMLTLFPLVTSASFNGLIEGLSHHDAPKCNPNATTFSHISKGDCGNAAIAVPFLVSFLVITFLVVVNMYIAVILENFNEAREEVQQGLTDDDYDMYYEHWKDYDPKCTEFIAYETLSDFVDSLEEPLRIKKPNRLKLIAMDLPVCVGNQIHCMDILDGLTKAFLSSTTPDVIDDNIDVVKNAVKSTERPDDYNPVTSTMEIARKEECARVITRQMRSYVKRKREFREMQQKNSSSIAFGEDTNI